MVSIKSQSSTNDETKFVFAVDKESNATITNVVVKYGSTPTPRDTLAGPVSNNDFMEHTNLAVNMDYVTEIEYTVSVNGTVVTPNVVIKKSDYNDFFRIGSTYAKIAKAKD